MPDIIISEHPVNPPRRPPHRLVLILLVSCIVVLSLFIVILFVTYSGEAGVTVIRIDGPIATGSENTGQISGSEAIGDELRNAADDPMVEAIVIRVNSPGGTPAGAQEIIEDIDYAKSKKPVVVSMGDMATSAAYWVSSHADRIYANPDTLTAGIGTIWEFSDISRWMSNEGYNTTVFKSGSFKDMGSTARTLTPEERELAQKIVNDSFETFIGDVLLQRKVSRDAIADARVMRGADARRIGLVDELGNLNDAIEGARELAKLRSSHLAMLS